MTSFLKTVGTILASGLSFACSLGLSVALANDRPNRGVASDLWKTKTNLKIFHEGRVRPLADKKIFESHYPADTCRLSIEDDDHRTQRLRYDCPAYYQGRPMSFTFTTNYSSNDLILTRVESNGKPLDATAMSLFSEDMSLDGFGSFQKLFDDAQFWDVSVRTKNGLAIKGKFYTIINHLKDTSYDCVLDAQKFPEFIVRCNTKNRQLSENDRWSFKFNKINEKEIELTNAHAELTGMEISGPKIEGFADILFRPEDNQSLADGLKTTATPASGSAAPNLPIELATRIREITISCKEDGIQVSAEREPGVARVDLNGDGSQDFLFDSQQVCGSSPGHGCSNRGCYLVAYKQFGPRAYRKVLEELYDRERFISISKNGRLNLIVYSSPGEFGRCKKSRHESCDYRLFWRNGGWVWQTVE